MTLKSNAISSTSQTYIYEYGADGIFRGKPSGYFFPLDNTYIDELTAIWPREAIRQQGLVTDQRELDAYRLSDQLIAVASTVGIMPTDAPVPLTFVRETTLLEFQLAGRNVAGLGIVSLILELELDGSTPTAFWAYCGNENGHAQLILPAGTAIEAPDGYMIGRIRGSDGADYTIIMEATDITLQAGTKYVITLTPRGYDMLGSVGIGGWIQEIESGIAIPFVQPVPNTDGDYLVQTAAQLITMSYLIRHYTDGTTIQWPDKRYILSEDLDLTDEEAQQYIPVPASLFNGKVTQDGEEVTSIIYGDGQVLELFDENQ
ncbi:MAG: hypothetical protein LUF85_12590 [Bacteroides sp.]|nr:hypothetical protein [Bacteroides sp.]